MYVGGSGGVVSCCQGLTILYSFSLVKKTRRERRKEENIGNMTLKQPLNEKIVHLQSKGLWRGGTLRYALTNIKMSIRIY